MKVLVLVAAAATFTTDLSHALSVGKRETPAVISLPIPIHIQPVLGGTFLTSKTESSAPGPTIRKRRNAKSRRAESDDSESEDSSDDEEEEVPTQQRKTFSAKLPLEVGAEPSEYSEAMRQGYETFQSSVAELGDSFAVKEGSGRRILDEGDLSFYSPPLAPKDTTTTQPIDIASGLRSFIADSNPKLAFPSTANSVAADRVTKPYAVASVPKDPSGANESTIRSKGKTGSPKAEADEPEGFISDQKAIKSYKSDATATDQSENKEKIPDGKTEGKTVAVKKIKANGTNFIVKVYVQMPGERSDKIDKDVNAVEDDPSDEEAPTAHGKGDVAGATADTKPKADGDTEERGQSEEPNLPKSASQTSTQQPSEQSPTKKPNTEKAGTEDPDTKESDDEELKDKELDDKERNEKKLDQEDSTEDEYDTKKSEKKSENKEPSKERDNELNEKKIEKQPESKAAAEKENKDRASGKPNHGDYRAFTPAGAQRDETSSTLSTETENKNFGNIVLSPELVNLITSWKGNSAKGETRDASHLAPLRQRKKSSMGK